MPSKHYEALLIPIKHDPLDNYLACVGMHPTGGMVVRWHILMTLISFALHLQELDKGLVESVAETQPKSFHDAPDKVSFKAQVGPTAQFPVFGIPECVPSH